MERIERGEIAFAGNAEGVVHAMRDKLVDEDFAAVKKEFGEAGALEVLLQTCNFAFMNRFTDGLQLPSEDEAIKVFARNLKDLLLAAPAGSRATMGLDPGIRTGVKVAVVESACPYELLTRTQRVSVPAIGTDV